MMRSVEWLDLLTKISIISFIGSEHYSDMAQTAEGRAIFIESCVEMLVQHNFDGLDLDWEYPGGREDSPGNHCFDFKFFLLSSHLRLGLCRAGNSLIGFPSKPLVFCPKMS